MLPEVWEKLVVDALARLMYARKQQGLRDDAICVEAMREAGEAYEVSTTTYTGYFEERYGTNPTRICAALVQHAANQIAYTRIETHSIVIPPRRRGALSPQVDLASLTGGPPSTPPHDISEWKQDRTTWPTMHGLPAAVSGGVKAGSMNGANTEDIPRQ